MTLHDATCVMWCVMHGAKLCVWLVAVCGDGNNPKSSCEGTVNFPKLHGQVLKTFNVFISLSNAFQP